MTKPDDNRFIRQPYRHVRKEAFRLLQEADALGTFPTPINDIMDAGKVTVAPENVLNEEFLCTIRHKAGPDLKTAVLKVIGLFDATERLIFIDNSVHLAKQNFLKLHETGHAVLPWQKNVYAVIEDSNQELTPNTVELFDREANVFAAEALFQNDGFIKEAVKQPFDIKVLINLSKKYGASIYASVCEYVGKNPSDCIVLVLNKPQGQFVGCGFRVRLLHTVASPSFQRKFSNQWPAYFTSGDEIGSMVPLVVQRMSRSRQISLVDRNGTRHECLAEGFTNTYQIFILIHVVHTMTKTTVISPAFS